jgi:hypothetical protein
VTSPFFLTRRDLWVCFRSGSHCPEVTDLPAEEGAARESIVDEQVIEFDEGSLAPRASEDDPTSVKDLLHAIHYAMAGSGSRLTRRPPGTTSFIDTDYFKDRLRSVLPEERLGQPLANAADEQVAQALGAERTVGEVLGLDLPTLARETGVDLPAAAQLRRRLLGLDDAAGRAEEA